LQAGAAAQEAIREANERMQAGAQPRQDYKGAEPLLAVGIGRLASLSPGQGGGEPSCNESLEIGYL